MGYHELGHALILQPPYVFFLDPPLLKAHHDIANQIEKLKASVMEASDRHKRVEVILVATAMTTATTIQQKIRIMKLSDGLLVQLMVPS